MLRRVSRAKAVLLAVFSAGLVAGCAEIAGEWFDVADRALIISTTQAALETAKTGEAQNWTNPENGHRGTVTPTRTYQRSDGPCRAFQQTATIGGRTVVGYDSACRDAAGQWQSRYYSTLAGAVVEGPYYPDDYYYRYPHYRFGLGYGHHHSRFGLGYGHHFGHFGHFH